MKMILNQAKLRISKVVELARVPLQGDRCRNSSRFASNWFPGSAGSAWELNALQAPPAAISEIPRTWEAEPPRQFVPRQSLGTRAFVPAFNKKCFN
jgi:hypothetical protein